MLSLYAFRDTLRVMKPDWPQYTRRPAFFQNWFVATSNIN
jgi:hypothetical protein